MKEKVNLKKTKVMVIGSKGEYSRVKLIYVPRAARGYIKSPGFRVVVKISLPISLGLRFTEKKFIYDQVQVIMAATHRISKRGYI